MVGLKNKIVSADEALAVVRDGDTVAFSGFVGIGTPDELILALVRRFETTGAPKDLTLMFAAAPGDGKERGLNRLACEGLVKRVVGGHWSLVPKLSDLALDEKIEAYNLPLGVISHLFRDIAARGPGFVTKVGMRTFVDPRLGGGKLNKRTHEDLVELIDIGGEEWLRYKSFPIQIAVLRGTTADPAGNITMEREALTLDNLAIAMAARNSGGLVIAQVERIAATESLNPREVVIPGVLVDCVVLASAENHLQTYRTAYNHAYSGRQRVPLDRMPPLPLDERKIIARRCAFELPLGGVVNLGIGMPEGVAAVAAEERVLRYLTLTAEPGIIGGMPQAGWILARHSTRKPYCIRTSSSISMMAAGLISPVSAWRRLTAPATSMSASSGVSSPAPAASSIFRRTRRSWFLRERSPPAVCRLPSRTGRYASCARAAHVNSSKRWSTSRFPAIMPPRSVSPSFT